jgi:hypothetical protein
VPKLVAANSTSTNRQRVPFVKSAVSLCVLRGMDYQLVLIAIYHKRHSFADPLVAMSKILKEWKYVRFKNNVLGFSIWVFSEFGKHLQGSSKAKHTK